VGYLASAGGLRSTAVGRSANASATESTVVGANATAAFVRSTAIGNGAATTANDQVTIGGTGSSVRIGDVAASTAAQVGPVEAVTVDSNGTLGTTAVASAAAVQDVRVGLNHIAAVTDAQFNAVSGRVSSLESGLANVNFRLDDLSGSAIGGVAAAMALGQAKIVPDSNISITVAGATYNGQQGFAGSLTGRVAEKVYLSAGISGNTGDDSVGGTVSATFGF